MRTIAKITIALVHYQAEWFPSVTGCWSEAGRACGKAERWL